MNTSALTINNSCPQCGKTSFKVIEFSDTIDFRGMELDVENLEESKCSSCGFKWTSKEQHESNESIIRAVYAKVRDKLREQHGLLLGHEIALIRGKLDLNQREAASLFGGGYNAFNKYESGEVLQSYAMDRLLRLTDVIGKPAVNFLRNVFLPPSFIVISISKNDSGVFISVGNNCISGSQIRTIGNSEFKELRNIHSFNWSNSSSAINFKNNFLTQ